MSWLDLRIGLEVTTHSVFEEAGTYTPPGGTPVPITGVFSQSVDVEEQGRLGYETTDMVFEVRKAADEGPWTASSFVKKGTLVISGQAYTVMYITQTDTLINIGIAPDE